MSNEKEPSDPLSEAFAAAQKRVEEAEAREKDRPPIKDSELLMSYEGAAFHANRMFASNVSAGMRLAFAEQHGDKVPPVFRTAVLLAYEDAEALRDLIDRQLSRLGAIRVKITEQGPEIVSGD